MSGGGEAPRSFAIEPGGKLLFVANRDSSNVTVFKIGSDGVPVATSFVVNVPSPTSVGAWRVP